MAVSARTIDRDRIGQKHMTFMSLTFTGTYSTGGESLTPKMLGMASRIFSVEVSGDTGGYVFVYDYANKKLKGYRDNATATAAPLPEINAGTSLTAITGLRVRAIGF